MMVHGQSMDKWMNTKQVTWQIECNRQCVVVSSQLMYFYSPTSPILIALVVEVLSNPFVMEGIGLLLLDHLSFR